MLRESSLVVKICTCVVVCLHAQMNERNFKRILHDFMVKDIRKDHE